MSKYPLAGSKARFAVPWLAAIVMTILANSAQAALVTITGRVVDADTFVGVSGIFIRATVGDLPVDEKYTSDKAGSEGTFTLQVPEKKGILELNFDDLTSPATYAWSSVGLLVAGDGIKLNVALVSNNSPSRSEATYRAHLGAVQREINVLFANPKADPAAIRKRIAPAIEFIDRAFWKKFENPPNRELNSLIEELQRLQVTPAPVFSPDSRLVLASTKSKKFDLFHITNQGDLGAPFDIPLDLSNTKGKDATNKFIVMEHDVVVIANRPDSPQFADFARGDMRWSKPAPLAANASPATAIAQLHNGRGMATGDATGLVSTFKMNEAKQFQLVQRFHDAASPIRDLAFSLDEKRLAAVSLASLSVWDLTDGKQIFRQDLGNDVVNVARFTKDGKNIVLGTGLFNKGTVRIVPLGGGNARTIFALPNGSITSLEVASHETVIAGSPLVKAVYLVDLRGANNKEKRVNGYGGTVSISSDGKLIGTVSPLGEPIVQPLPKFLSSE